MSRDRSIQSTATKFDRALKFGDGNVMQATVPDGEIWYVEKLVWGGPAGEKSERGAVGIFDSTSVTKPPLTVGATVATADVAGNSVDNLFSFGDNIMYRNRVDFEEAAVYAPDRLERLFLSPDLADNRSIGPVIGTDSSNAYIHNNRGIASVSLSDGTENWSFSGEGVRNPRRAVLIGDKIYHTTEFDRAVRAVDTADGSEVWRLSTSYAPFTISQRSDGELFVAEYDSGSSELYATVIDYTGGTGTEVFSNQLDRLTKSPEDMPFGYDRATDSTYALDPGRERRIKNDVSTGNDVYRVDIRYQNVNYAGEPVIFDGDFFYMQIGSEQIIEKVPKDTGVPVWAAHLSRRVTYGSHPFGSIKITPDGDVAVINNLANDEETLWVIDNDTGRIVAEFDVRRSEGKSVLKGRSVYTVREQNNPLPYQITKQTAARNELNASPRSTESTGGTAVLGEYAYEGDVVAGGVNDPPQDIEQKIVARRVS